MPIETISTPVQKLIEYSRRAASAEDVVRSFLNYRDWLAPAMLFAGTPARDSNGHLSANIDKPLVLFSKETNCPADELYFFTDQSAAEVAQAAGAKLGLYARNIAGTELFAKVTPNLKIVRINPSSPKEENFFFQKESFKLLQMWVKAITLEASFVSSGKLDFKAISQYKYYTVFLQPNGFYLTAPNQCGMKNPLLVFTAVDCINAFLSKMGDQPKVSESRQVNSDGLSILKNFENTDIDGILFNVFGPGKQAYFAFSEIGDINALESF